MTPRLLNAEEVKALPDGTHIMIRWSGGNGPFMYEKRSVNGVPYAASIWPPHTIIKDGNLDGVLGESPKTEVWIPEKEEAE